MSVKSITHLIYRGRSLALRFRQLRHRLLSPAVTFGVSSLQTRPKLGSRPFSTPGRLVGDLLDSSSRACVDPARDSGLRLSSLSRVSRSAADLALLPYKASLMRCSDEVHQPRENARTMHGIATAKPKPKIYLETYESDSFSGKTVRFMVKNAATNDNGENTIVTMVKTSTARPCLAASSARSRENSSSNAL